jgi:hypothetical protein
MPDFVAALAQYAEANRSSLRMLFEHERLEEEKTLYDEFRRGHWHPLQVTTKRKGVARLGVDGGLRTLGMSNGALLIIAQAVLLAHDCQETPEDVAVVAKVLRGSVPPQTASRYADLLRQQIEIDLAAKHFPRLDSGVGFLDGALSSMLPQLYPLSALDAQEDPTLCLIEAYGKLFAASTPDRQLIAIAKSSRAANLSYVLQANAGIAEDEILKVPDSEVICRWAADVAGFSTPVLVGKRGFSMGASFALIEQGGPIPEMPAIVTFFVRPCDFAPPLRIDVPCTCLGRSDTIGDVDIELLSATDILPIVESVMADWGGGPAIHNLLLWAADDAVALHKDAFLELYLPILRDILGVDLEPSQSASRFL